MIILDPPGVQSTDRQPRRALFLDRDGVINIDKGWVHRVEDIEWIDGIFDVVRTALEEGCIVIVVTNQGGIARGYYDEAAFRALSEWMLAEFSRVQTPLARIVGCPHHPEGQVATLTTVCNCRKPAPGMLIRSAEDLHIELASSVMIGDHEKDMQAALSAGISRRILLDPDGKMTFKPGGMRVASLRDSRISHLLKDRSKAVSDYPNQLDQL